MPPINDLSQLTRSILLGVSVGTVPLTQVGCALFDRTGDTARAAVPSEQEDCSRALASKTAADVNLVLERHPASQCIPSLLSAMPPATLAALSPTALRGVSPEVLRAVPTSVRKQLATYRPPPPPAAEPEPIRRVRPGRDIGTGY